MATKLLKEAKVQQSLDQILRTFEGAVDAIRLRTHLTWPRAFTLACLDSKTATVTVHTSIGSRTANEVEKYEQLAAAYERKRSAENAGHAQADSAGLKGLHAECRHIPGVVRNMGWNTSVDRYISALDKDPA